MAPVKYSLTLYYVLYFVSYYNRQIKLKIFSLPVNGIFVNKLVKKSSTERIKILSLSQYHFSWKIMPIDKANAVKVSRKITTQYG